MPLTHLPLGENVDKLCRRRFDSHYCDNLNVPHLQCEGLSADPARLVQERSIDVIYRRRDAHDAPRESHSAFMQTSRLEIRPHHRILRDCQWQ